jgi:hypothetical protein
VSKRNVAKYLTPAARAERELGIDERWSPDAVRAPIGFHIVLRLVDDRVIVRTAAERRTLSLVLYEQGEGRGLVAFRAADTHLHILMIGSRFEAGMLARYVAMSLRWQLGLGAPFLPANIRPLMDRRHLENGVRYAFKQEPHHGIDLDPFHDASSLLDMVGLRVLGAATAARLFAALPRLSKATLLADGGLELGDTPSEAAVAEHLLEATLAAGGLASLTRNDASHAARCAAVHAVALKTSVVAAALGIDPASVRRLRRKTPDSKLVAAIQRQLALRAGARKGGPLEGA